MSLVRKVMEDWVMIRVRTWVKEMTYYGPFLGIVGSFWILSQVD